MKRAWKRPKVKNSQYSMAVLLAISILISIFHYQLSHGGMQKIAKLILKIQVPGVAYQLEEPKKTIFDWSIEKVLKQISAYQICKEKEQKSTISESAISYELYSEDETTEKTMEDYSVEENQDYIEANNEEVFFGDFREDVLKKYKKRKLKKYEYLVSHFYHVDSTTVLKRSLMKFSALFNKDLTISSKGKEPKVLIYHTHAHEEYRTSRGTGKKTVVDLGEELSGILEEKYHIPVLHHKGVYDKERDIAYSKALPAIEKLLEEHPSIEVVIDLHRDGVAEETRLVSKVNGKKMAKIMFFNGVSRTKMNGELSYIKNKNIKTNLAFSLQMQLALSTYYESLARGIYIKGYRYNMHIMPKTLLVEVGAQNNTYKEAKNSMGPLADTLAKVLKGD